ncbi:hypothetical protein [Methylorubrum sp. SB2]
MRLYRLGLAGFLGALAGMVLFPRPAQGGRRAERETEPACAAPDRRRR